MLIGRLRSSCFLVSVHFDKRWAILIVLWKVKSKVLDIITLALPLLYLLVNVFKTESLLELLITTF